MNLNKYTIINTLIYGTALFGPAAIISLFQIENMQSRIILLILFNIIGATLMIYFTPKLETPLDVEEKRRKVSTKRAIAEGFIGIPIVIAAQSIANMLEMTFSRQPIASENTQNIISLIQDNFAFVLIVAIAGPIMEELFFRRTLIGIIGNKFDFLIGVLASSMLFSLAHADGHFLVYFIMGATFALLYRSTGNIITSIIAHCGMNTFVVIMNVFVTQILESLRNLGGY